MFSRARFSARFSLWLFFLALLCCRALVPGYAQTPSDSPSNRRLVYRTTPPYPVLAKNLGLSGVVRLEAVVSADGSVKSVEPKGGHPVLSQAAANAVRQWKWEAASAESRELVQVKFSPE